VLQKPAHTCSYCACLTCSFTQGRRSVSIMYCLVWPAVDTLQFRIRTRLQIPTKQQELNRDTGSAPLFTNQIFEEEEVQGYQGLAIDVVLDTAEYIPRLFQKHSFKAEKRADDCLSLISTHFTEGLATSPAECAAMHVCFLCSMVSCFVGLPFSTELIESTHEHGMLPAVEWIFVCVNFYKHGMSWSYVVLESQASSHAVWLHIHVQK
jgi:Histone acetyl transferase HAT1 N-terminus